MMPTRKYHQDLAAQGSDFHQDLAAGGLAAGPVLSARRFSSLFRSTSGRVQFGIGLGRVRQFLADKVKHRGLCRKLLNHAGPRVGSSNFLRHMNLRRVMAYLIIAVLLVHLDHVAKMLWPVSADLQARLQADLQAKADALEIKCPDGYAYRIPEEGPHFGRYVACENFNQYYIDADTSLDLAARWLVGGRQ